ncbi:vWA domain-containing protein [Xanthobacter pseudotagetidis]|uniref:vWA domain-containing protein n=1 Tax=Xanthobacter pseudotagetidis TaxID=3119911 RepID=UPI003728BA3C
MIAFQWLWAFALLPLPLLMRWLMPRTRQPRSGALRVPFYDDLAAAGLATRGARRARALRLLLLWLIWGLLVSAAARPAYLGKPVAIPVAGRDLMMAVDLSGSMARDDLALGGALVADRLTVVKSVVDEFLARRKGDRVGLILFGSRAYLQAPLTFDRKVVRELLAGSAIGLAGPETAIGDAIALAVKTLRTRPEGQRVLILLTDGASNSGMLDPIDAAGLARQAGVKIYTIGVGADRMPGGLGFGQRIVNPSADLDEEALQQIADLTGGRYFRGRDGRGLAAIYDDIQRMEPVAGDPLYLTPTVSLFQWPLGAALVLSLAFAAVLARPRLSGRPAAEAAPAPAEAARP